MKRDLWSWVGIWIVGATAAVWSFTSLSALAELVGIREVIDLPLSLTIHISWGLPVTVDVLAVVATRVWLRGTAPAEAVQYAKRAAWVAIGASVVGNAYHGWLTGGRIDTVIISAVPAVVIGALVHLAVLTSRPATPVALPIDLPIDLPSPPVEVDPTPPTAPMQVVTVESREEAQERLLREGAGRQRLQEELGLTEWQARELVRARKKLLETGGDDREARA